MTTFLLNLINNWCNLPCKCSWPVRRLPRECWITIRTIDILHTQSDFDKWLSVRQAAQMLYRLDRAIGDISWLFHPKQGVNAPPHPCQDLWHYYISNSIKGPLRIVGQQGQWSKTPCKCHRCTDRFLKCKKWRDQKGKWPGFSDLGLSHGYV